MFTASIASGWSDNWFTCSIEAVSSFDLTPYPPSDDVFLSIEDGNEPWNMTKELYVIYSLAVYSIIFAAK